MFHIIIICSGACLGSYTMGAFFTALKWPGREADHPFTLLSKLRMRGDMLNFPIHFHVMEINEA